MVAATFRRWTVRAEFLHGVSPDATYRSCCVLLKGWHVCIGDVLLLGIDVPLRSGICTAAWYKTGVSCGILFERPDTGNVRYVCMGVMLIRRVIWVCAVKTSSRRVDDYDWVTWCSIPKRLWCRKVWHVCIGDSPSFGVGPVAGSDLLKSVLRTVGVLGFVDIDRP